MIFFAKFLLREKQYVFICVFIIIANKIVTLNLNQGKRKYEIL